MAASGRTNGLIDRYCTHCDEYDEQLKRRALPCLPLFEFSCDLCACCPGQCVCQSFCCCCFHVGCNCGPCCVKINENNHPRKAACGWATCLMVLLFVPTVVITALYWHLYADVVDVGQVACTTTKVWASLTSCGDDEETFPCLCPHRRVEYYRPADPPPNGTAYGHNFSPDGYVCCAWYGYETKYCGYNSSYLLEPVLVYLNKSEACWIHYNTGTYFQSDLVIGGTTPPEALHRYGIAWMVFIAVFSFISCGIWYCCRMGRIKERIEATRPERHDMHSNGLHTFLLGLHPKIGGDSLRSFVSNPLYDHRIMPKLISSFAFPEVSALVNDMLARDGSFAIGIKGQINTGGYDDNNSMNGDNDDVEVKKGASSSFNWSRGSSYQPPKATMVMSNLAPRAPADHKYGPGNSNEYYYDYDAITSVQQLSDAGVAASVILSNLHKAAPATAHGRFVSDHLARMRQAMARLGYGTLSKEPPMSHDLFVSASTGEMVTCTSAEAAALFGRIGYYAVVRAPASTFEKKLFEGELRRLRQHQQTTTAAQTPSTSSKAS